MRELGRATNRVLRLVELARLDVGREAACEKRDGAVLRCLAFASVVRADSKPGYTTLEGIVSEEAKRARLETARTRRICDDEARIRKNNT